jgi:glycosyltransferase involved in cell wall biosynthesis
LLIGYHGSLYGDWFDWEGLRAVADAFPKAAVVVIGDDKVARPEMPANVHFLGLKPQSELPAYLQRLDVGILPFKLNDTTHAVSPLKVYEYLASGVPVAAPPLRSLEGLDGVVTGSLISSVERALDGDRPDPARMGAEHSWVARVEELLTLTGRVRMVSSSEQSKTRVVFRVVRHWARNERTGHRGPRPD